MDKELVDKLTQRDSQAFEYVYRECFPRKDNFITRNSGTMLDAQDVFQEAMVILLRKLRTTKFELTTFICKYINSISVRLWLIHLRKEKRKDGLDERKMQSLDEQLLKEINTIMDSDLEAPNSSKIKAKYEIFKTLPENCRKILIARHVHKLHWAEIGAEFGQTYGSIRVKGTRCINDYKAKLKKAGLE